METFFEIDLGLQCFFHGQDDVIMFRTFHIHCSHHHAWQWCEYSSIYLCTIVLT